MRFERLIYDGKEIKENRKIHQILEKEKLFWLLPDHAEIEGADIEIKNGTVIWNRGNFYSGNWHFGIFRGGHFVSGTFENGILEGGIFDGNFVSGIRVSEI